jgi:Domain of unknown function (DUF7025)
MKKESANSEQYDDTTLFAVDCEYIDYDGKRFGPIYQRFSIDPFDGEQEIDLLKIFPLEYAKDKGILDVEKFRQRGEKFMEFVEPRHRKYDGQSLVHWPTGSDLVDRRGFPAEVTSINGEVVVDFKRALAFSPSWTPIMASGMPVCAPMDSRECNEGGEKPEAIDKDYEWDKQLRLEVMGVILKQSRKYLAGPKTLPKDDDVLLLPQRVYGYVLRTRRWGEFST